MNHDLHTAAALEATTLALADAPAAGVARLDPGHCNDSRPKTRAPVRQSGVDDGLLTMVDFKWLMVGLGWRVDLTRLRRDTAYLGECARRGLASGSALLRECSVELLRLQSVVESAAAAPA